MEEHPFRDRSERDVDDGLHPEKVRTSILTKLYGARSTSFKTYSSLLL